MSTERFELIAPCHFGLESVLAGEIRRLDGQEVAASDGRVSFSGDFPSFGSRYFYRGIQ